MLAALATHNFECISNKNRGTARSRKFNEIRDLHIFGGKRAILRRKHLKLQSPGSIERRLFKCSSTIGFHVRSYFATLTSDSTEWFLVLLRSALFSSIQLPGTVKQSSNMVRKKNGKTYFFF